MKKNSILKLNDNWSELAREIFDIEEPYEYYSEVSNFDLKKPIPKNIGEGFYIKFIDTYGKESEYYIKVPKNPVVELNITSFIGISAGAVHYYGKLHVYDFDITEDINSNMSSGGFLGMENKKFPFIFQVINSGIQVKLNRLITKNDIKNHPDMFENYYEGEETYRFWEEEDVIKLGKEVAKEFFPDFKLKIRN